MSIGRFENIVVRPVCRGQIVVRGQLAQVSGNVILIAGTIQYSIGNLHNFCAGNCIIRTESTIRVTSYPAFFSCRGDGCVCPMVGRDIREGLGAARQLVKASCDCCKFCTSNSSIRTEGAISVALEDTCIGQSSDFCRGPAVVYISEVVYAGCVYTTSIITE